MRASLAESIRLFAHPKTVKEIASVSPTKRKLIKDDIALTSRQKPKTATALVWRLWCLGFTSVKMSDCPVAATWPILRTPMGNPSRSSDRSARKALGRFAEKLVTI
jgi:hypothetical protein